MTFSPDRFDEIRANNPELGFALYAMEPGGSVTLEVHTPDEQVFTFTGKTARQALDKAFPPAPTTDPEPTQPAPDIFG